MRCDIDDDEKYCVRTEQLSLHPSLSLPVPFVLVLYVVSVMLFFSIHHIYKRIMHPLALIMSKYISDRS